jgi:protein-disulfide isomerase|tara:strand:- start:602 stop:853 length:252 start_codon:yes stop_codon:yes gene_type:complete
LTLKKERSQNQSKPPKVTGQKNWMMMGGVTVVIVAIAIVAYVRFSPEETIALDDNDAAVVLSTSSLIGDPNAPVTLVEFGDFQ